MSSKVPVPALVRLVAAPARTEVMVSEALLTVVVWEPDKVMVPVERTMAPEPDAKVMLPNSPC